MRRTLSLFAAFSLVLVSGAAGRAQDSPSLGDLARQAQKDKEKDKASKPAAKVFTNEDMPSSAGIAGAFGGGAGMGQDATNLTPAQQLAAVEALVNKIDTIDKATLVKNVLKDKSDVNFPGRAAWEQRLMTAKAAYVEQSRTVLQRAKQIVASAGNLKGADENDPRVKEVAAKLQNLSRDAVQTNAGLQAVVVEGQDLATQASAH